MSFLLDEDEEYLARRLLCDAIDAEIDYQAGRDPPPHGCGEQHYARLAKLHQASRIAHGPRGIGVSSHPGAGEAARMVSDLLVGEYVPRILGIAAELMSHDIGAAIRRGKRISPYWRQLAR